MKWMSKKSMRRYLASNERRWENRKPVLYGILHQQDVIALARRLAKMRRAA